MKKIIIAIFCATLMLVLPISSVALTTDLEKNPIIINEEEMPKFTITQSQKSQLDQFVNSIGDSETQQQARSLLSTLLVMENEYYKINMQTFSEALSLIGFRPIPEDELNIDMIVPVTTITEDYLNNLMEEYWGIVDWQLVNNPIGDLIQKIIQMIKDRLGWVYTFFTEGISLFLEGINIFSDFLKTQGTVIVAIIASFALTINQILKSPEKIKDLIGLLFDKEFQEFVNELIAFKDEFVSNCQDILNRIKIFVENFNVISAYLDEINDYLDWINSDPWTQDISISGRVTTLFGGVLSGATVTCRGETVTTNSNGEFSFSVPSTPNEDSIPANQWYGMHNCQIKVTVNGETKKETSKWLSYSFSGGEVNWGSLVVVSKSREMKHIFIEIIQNILLKIEKILTINPYKSI